MSVITEEKENNKVFLDAEDLEYKIEILKIETKYKHDVLLIHAFF